MKSEESRWWSEAAGDDWKAFEVLKREGNYSAAVFHLQQAAEKMLKAVTYHHRRPAFTHSTVDILKKLDAMGVSISDELHACARRLDPHYVTARYPNGVGGIPRDFYDLDLVEELESCSRKLMNFAESKLFEPIG